MLFIRCELIQFNNWKYLKKNVSVECSQSNQINFEINSLSKKLKMMFQKRLKMEDSCRWFFFRLVMCENVQTVQLENRPTNMSTAIAEYYKVFSASSAMDVRLKWFSLLKLIFMNFH